MESSLSKETTNSIKLSTPGKILIIGGYAILFESN